MKLNISKNLNNTFYINKLHLTNIDFLLNQSVDDMQPSSIQENKKKIFIVENIMIEMKNKKRKK